MSIVKTKHTQNPLKKKCQFAFDTGSKLTWEIIKMKALGNNLEGSQDSRPAFFFHGVHRYYTSNWNINTTYYLNSYGLLITE